MLTLVLVGVVVSSSLFGPGEPGAAVRQEPPVPPAAGTCVGEPNYLEPVFVPCTEPHLGEVFLAWTGRLPDSLVPPLAVPAGAFADDPRSWCAGVVDDHLGLGAILSQRVEWSLPGAGSAVVLVRGPEAEYLPGWSWTACVLLPTRIGTNSDAAPFTGVLSNVLTDPSSPRPEVWRRCGGAWAEIDCSAAHRSEQVATATVQVSPAEMVLFQSGDVTFTDPVVEAECSTLVDRFLGRSGGAPDPRLRPVVSYLGPDLLGTTGGEPSGVSFDCSVEVVGEQDLVGSVAGLGTGPLPLG